MRILVIDDTPLHQESARQTLGGHDVTIVGTYDEAEKLLKIPNAPEDAVYEELKNRGFKVPWHKDTTEEEAVAARAEYAVIKDELRPLPFDAVLTDLLMPAGERDMAGEGLKFVGQEMPVGFALSLMAVVHGAKFVAVATDAGHHDHPASAMFDNFGSRCPNEDGMYARTTSFVMNGAEVRYYHSPMMFVDGTTCTHCDGTSSKEKWCHPCRSTGKQSGKDWGSVIAHLTT